MIGFICIAYRKINVSIVIERINLCLNIHFLQVRLDGSRVWAGSVFGLFQLQVDFLILWWCFCHHLLVQGLQRIIDPFLLFLHIGFHLKCVQMFLSSITQQF